MSGENGLVTLKKGTLALAGSIIVTVTATLSAVGSWRLSIATDAAFHERVEAHMRESEPIWDDVHQNHDITRQNRSDIEALRKEVAALVASQTRTNDKIDLLIQTMMRRGEINR